MAAGGTQAGDEIRAAGPYGRGAPTAAFCTNDLLALGLLRRFVFTPDLITRASSQPEPARPAPGS